MDMSLEQSDTKMSRARRLDDETNNRCLIVLDNIWTASVWNVVRQALPEDCRCRIVVTTEVDDVAQACSVYKAEHNASHENRKYIFKMEPFKDDLLRDIIVSRVFGDKDKCPEALNEPSNEIARRCGGLPLAAMAAACLLASWPDKRDEWNYVQNSLIPNLRIQPISKGMTQLLNNSFNNLPHHLKACMLYLSIYKEDQVINLNCLLKQWIAEDFISENDSGSSEKVARSHFYELVRRGMIVPEHINYNDEVVSCTVHDMVLNFVRHKAMEENFVTAIDHSQTGIKLADKVRRLSLHMGYSEYATPPAGIRMSQLRSLVFSGLFKFVPSIWKFNLLRVVSLEGKQSEVFDLTRICELFLLRYLQIEGNICVDLPSNLQGLKYLKTLHIGALVTFLRSDIVHLPRSLLHLRLPPSLQQFVDPGNVDSIDELTNLQDLQLACPQTATPDRIEHNMKLLVSILRKLESLSSLTVINAHFSEDANIRKNSNIAIFLDALDSLSSPPSDLQRLQLFPRVCVLPRLPKWIAKLKTLCILKVSVMELRKEDIEILSQLSCLEVFSLYVRTTPAEPIIFGISGFTDLKYFKFKCSTVSSLSFVEGAMPKLQRLKMEFNGSTLERCNTAIVCFKHCSGVKEVILKIWGAGTGVFDRMTVASDVTNAIMKNTGIPNLTIDHTDHSKLSLVDTMIPWPSPCNGCGELGAGRRYKCEQCNSKVYYDMCCATAPRTLVHPLFPGNAFEFRRQPIASECGRACDACGDLMHGFGYHCRDTDLDLHPRCARLPVRAANAVKGYTLELCRAASASRCCICMCGKEGYRHNFWAYRFCHKGQPFYLHMACLKDWASRSHETLTRMYEILMGGPQETPTDVSREYTSDHVGSSEQDDDTLVRQDEITETVQQKEVHSIQQHDREEHTEKEADAR
uniref:Uncharacterized protein n=1 Tax=Oryza glumipatula TaxID=40148 RepID=A0A0E0AV02_9ORYZ